MGPRFERLEVAAPPLPPQPAKASTASHHENKVRIPIDPAARGSRAPKLTRARHSGKLTVALDLDETLVHSRVRGRKSRLRVSGMRPETTALEEFDVKLCDGQVLRVAKRPGLDEFLAEAAKRYELVVYTAGHESYARPVLAKLDPTGTIFSRCLCRDACLNVDGYLLKDLTKIDRPLSRVVLVDNSAMCCLPQLANGVPIRSFYDDPSDSALPLLQTFLRKLDACGDVRPTLRAKFQLEKRLGAQRDYLLGDASSRCE